MSESGRYPRKGRFDTPSSPGKDFRRILAGIWDGIRLRCPSCGEGQIYSRGFQTNRQCSQCGAPFERPGEGDFLMALIFAYSVAGIAMLTVIFLLNRYTDLDITIQLLITLPLGALVVLLTFRSVKGAWIALLIALLKWDR